MFILKKLTWKDLKLNKKRTTSTLVGIILSAALICVVLGMEVILRNTLIKSTIEDTGYFHIQLSNIDEKDIDLLKVNRDFNHMEVVKDLGYTFVYFKDNMDEYSLKDIYNLSHVYSMNYETFNYLKYNLTDGRFPTNKNEVLMPNRFLEDLNLKIGDRISLNVGELVNDEGIKIKEGYITTRKLINENNYTFIVVGTISGNSTIITTDKNSIYNDVYLTLKNPINYKQDFKELLGCTNNTYCEDKYSDYFINNELLRWEVFNFDENTICFLYGLIGIIIFVILITSVFSVRNSIAISTTEKSKMYGMLRSIGSTKKQIKKMVLYEGIILGIIGITLGCILGILVTYILTIIVNSLMINGGMFDDKMHLYYKFSIIPIIISYIVGYTIIYLSSIPSIYKASNTNPIEIIRDNDIENNNLKVPKLISKIFKIGGSISYKNLKRSKRKYRVTVVSLTISIFVFIVVGTFLNYGLKNIGDSNVNYDLMIHVNNYDDIDIDKLKMGEHYMNYFPKVGNYILYDKSHIIIADMLTEFCIKKNENGTCDELKEGVFSSLRIYDDDSFKKIAKQVKVNYNNVKDKAIIINYKMNDLENSKKELIKISNYKVGDKITLKNYDTNNSITYEIGALTDYLPVGTFYSYFTIIVDKDYCKLDDIKLNSIYYINKNADKIENSLREISDNFSFDNAQKDMKQRRTLILVISIFIYGFIIVVTLIGLTSVFNTITSNMVLRQKDFAILKSIGMTKKEFNNMITFEALFYSFKSLLYGVVLGITGSVIVYKIYSLNIDYGYMLPINSILISIVFIVFVVLIIMKYSINKINKQNIIETIRQNNI